MSHADQKIFCAKIKNRFPEFFNKVRVLDIGSLDINGNNRVYFDESDYIGIDLGKGRNVDMVCKAHEFPVTQEKFDVVISTECFEHDMFLEKTILHVTKLLRSGGLFLFTCATGKRREHGTINTSRYDSPFTFDMKDGWESYYKNVSEEMIRNIIDVDNTFITHEFNIARGGTDLQFWGILN